MLSYTLYKHLLATLWLTGALFFASAQTVWNKTYLEGRPVMVFSSVMQRGDGYDIIGVTYGTLLNKSKVWLCNIDQSGDVIDSKIADDSIPVKFVVLTNAFIKESGGLYAFTGYSSDTGANLLFGRVDTILDTVKLYRYYTPNTLAYHGYSIISYENDFYVTGIRTELSSNNGNVFLTKIDSSGNRLWEKFYNQRVYDKAKSLIKLRNGNLLIGASRSDNSQINEHSNTWLLEVDTVGVIQRQWFDPNDSTYAAEGLLELSDGGFIYGGQKKFRLYGGTVSYVSTIVRLDSSFNKQWTFTGGAESVYGGITDIEQLPDGNFIACGNTPYYETDSNMLSGWIIKLSASGQVLWNRVYRGIPYDETLNFLSDIDILPDGGFIAVGQCQYPGHFPPQIGWFLKLDSNGCEIENCLVGIEPTPKSPKGDLNSQIQVWPNPFATDVSIALTGEHVTGATFTITNLMGQVVYQQTEANLSAGYTKMLDLSYLPNEVYFIEVSTAGSKAVQRVVKQ